MTKYPGPMGDLLFWAANTVHKRTDDYGTPMENHKRIADLWSAYFSGTKSDVRPHDVAVAMILAKIARLEQSPKHKDSWTDIAGYAAVGWEIVSTEERDG